MGTVCRGGRGRCHLNRTHPVRQALTAAVVLALLAGGIYYLIERTPGALPDASDTARAIVEGFGRRLQQVPLSASPDVTAQAIEENYAPYVSEALLTYWMNNPGEAPGRLTSSPWPDRIEVTSITRNANDTYNVACKIIEITSVELATGGAAGSFPCGAIVSQEGTSWRITSFES